MRTIIAAKRLASSQDPYGKGDQHAASYRLPSSPICVIFSMATSVVSAAMT